MTRADKCFQYVAKVLASGKCSPQSKAFFEDMFEVIQAYRGSISYMENFITANAIHGYEFESNEKLIFEQFEEAVKRFNA